MFNFFYEILGHLYIFFGKKNLLRFSKSVCFFFNYLDPKLVFILLLQVPIRQRTKCYEYFLLFYVVFSLLSFLFYLESGSHYVAMAGQELII